MKDWCNNEGAKRLREKIREYWAERGYEVDVDLVQDELRHILTAVGRRLACGWEGHARIRNEVLRA